MTVLVGNALKFTESGSIEVEVDRDASEGETVWLHFLVRDTGIGMTTEQLDTIFHSFTQADGSLTRKYGGTGLGLSIAQHLMDVLGGRLWADSLPGQGSTFHCLLPFSTAMEECPSGVKAGDLAEKTATPASAAMAEAAAIPHILLVEDNEINQEIACELLRGMQVEVEVADNGAIALEMVKERRFDMIFMDIQMPVMDGLEATRRIRASDVEWARDVPIIAMTAHALSDDREQSLSAGMNAHLTKPINPEALQRVVAIWLPDTILLSAGETIATEVIQAAPESSELDLSSLHGINIASGISNVAGNEALYLDLLRRFAAKYRNSHKELPELLNAYETESAARLAHTIKGVAANLGATRLANQAKDIESAILANEPIDALLAPYAADLEKVTLSIDQLIASRDAMQETDDQCAILDPGSIPHIVEELERLPLLMQTDWGQAQTVVEELGTLLEHTEFTDPYSRLRNALEEFDVVDFTNTAMELRQRLKARQA